MMIFGMETCQLVNLPEPPLQGARQGHQTTARFRPFSLCCRVYHNPCHQGIPSPTWSSARAARARVGSRPSTDYSTATRRVAAPGQLRAQVEAQGEEARCAHGGEVAGQPLARKADLELRDRGTACRTAAALAACDLAPWRQSRADEEGNATRERRRERPCRRAGAATENQSILGGIGGLPWGAKVVWAVFSSPVSL